MEITDLVEKNSSLLRLGLHLEFNDARHRVAAHLQRNIDRSKLTLGIDRWPGRLLSLPAICRRSALVSHIVPLLLPSIGLGIFLIDWVASLARLGELQQGMLASGITNIALPSSSNQSSLHHDHSDSKAAKDISPTRLKSLAAFEQFIKARTWTDPSDTVTHNLPPAGRLVRNLQAEASASTSGSGAEKKI